MDDREEFNFDRVAKSLEQSIEGSQDPLANGKLNELNADYQEVAKKARTAILMLYRTTCPYCERLRSILEDLADEFDGTVFFGSVNIDLVEEARERFNVFGVPFVVALKRGMPVARVEGLRKSEEYYEWIDQLRRGIRPMRLKAGETTALEE